MYAADRRARLTPRDAHAVKLYFSRSDFPSRSLSESQHRKDFFIRACGHVVTNVEAQFRMWSKDLHVRAFNGSLDADCLAWTETLMFNSLLPYGAE